MLVVVVDEVEAVVVLELEVEVVLLVDVVVVGHTKSRPDAASTCDVTLSRSALWLAPSKQPGQVPRPCSLVVLASNLPSPVDLHPLKSNGDPAKVLSK